MTLIKVSKEFRINGGGIWLGMETNAQPGMEIEEFVKANQTLNDAFNAINGGGAWSGNEEKTVISGKIPEVDRGKETQREIIADCNTIEELERQVNAVDKYDLWNEYNARYEALQNRPA